MNHDPFDRLAEGYDEWYLRSPELFRAELGALLSLGLEGRGLDVGTGTGIFAGEAGTGICLDPSLPMLRKAVGRCDPVRGVAEGLPFAPSVFDYVMMTATLSFLPRPERAVREAHRVLRSGGFLALCIIPRDSEWGRLYMEKAKRGHPVYGDA
ncbi:MAG: class I SAM-dependent methyltransferase [Thermoplasmatota archaeon]